MERKVIGLGLDQLPRTFDFKDAGNLPQTGGLERLHTQPRCRAQRPFQ